MREKVSVEVISYKLDTNLLDKNGEVVANEGFSVRLSSENPEVQAMIDQISERGKNWHITGSFMRKGDAVYTNNIDFSDGEPCSFIFEGVFRDFEVFIH